MGLRKQAQKCQNINLLNTDDVDSGWINKRIYVGQTERDKLLKKLKKCFKDGAKDSCTIKLML